MSVLGRTLDPNNIRPFMDVISVGSELVRDLRDDLREDRSFLTAMRRSLLPLPTDREPVPDLSPFPSLSRFGASVRWRKRVAVVASGGSGATSAVAGVQRAFEEAGIEPVAISACSGAVLFASLWACGFDAETIARFWLMLPRTAYVDPDWRALVKSTSRALGGWAGLLRGEALERSVRGLLGDRRLGEMRIPFSMPAWNVDLNRIEFLGTRSTPDLPVALAIRSAISIPIFVEPVRIGEHFYGDGGIVNIFPVRPVLDDSPDAVIGLNCYLPENFAGEDVTGWRQRSFAVLRVSGQLRWSGMVALAREQALLVKDRLELLHPVPYAEVRGARFYETFVDRSAWPRFMRAGRDATRNVLGRAAPPHRVRTSRARRAKAARPSRRRTKTG